MNPATSSSSSLISGPPITPTPAPGRQGVGEIVDHVHAVIEVGKDKRRLNFKRRALERENRNPGCRGGLDRLLQRSRIQTPECYAGNPRGDPPGHCLVTELGDVLLPEVCERQRTARCQLRTGDGRLRGRRSPLPDLPRSSSGSHKALGSRERVQSFLTSSLFISRIQRLQRVQPRVTSPPSPTSRLKICPVILRELVERSRGPPQEPLDRIRGFLHEASLFVKAIHRDELLGQPAG